MKFFYQLALLSILSVGFARPSYALCQSDRVKWMLKTISILHRKSVDILMDMLDPQNTTVCLDFKNLLDTGASFESMKHDYVMAERKIFEISTKLDIDYGKDGNWTSFRWVANLIRNKMISLNHCFGVHSVQDTEVATSGDEDALIAKLLRALLEMFIAETFLIERLSQCCHRHH